MPRKVPKSRPIIHSDRSEAEFQEPLREEYVPSETESNIDRLLSQFDEADVMIKVYEVKQPGDREFFLYNISKPTPDKISEEAIRSQNHGRGGEFKLNLMVNGEFRSHQKMLLADSPGLDASVPAVATDPTTLLLQKIAALEAKINAQPMQPREPISDLVGALVQLQAMNKPAESNIDTIMKYIELGKSIGANTTPGMDWPGIIGGILKEAAPAILPAMMAAGPRPTANGSAAIPAAPEENPSVLEEQMLKQGIAYLKKKCISGSDPGLYLDMIIDNADEQPYNKLVHLATTQEFSAFEALDPDIRNEPYRPYFRSIYDGLRQYFTRPDKVVGDSTGTSGNAGDAASDGGVSKAGGT